MSESVLLTFSSWSFRYCVIFKSSSHHEVIFAYGVRGCSNFVDLHVAVQLSQHHLLESGVFYPLYTPVSSVED